MITKKELEDVKQYLCIIRHAVGADHKTQPGYRNMFCADIGSTHYHRLKEMVTLGLAREGHKINLKTAQYFYITLEGCEFASLPIITTNRAMSQ